MLCSICSLPPQEPVVSKISGCLYERRLIEKHLKETGRCPKTNEIMNLDDLIPVTCSVASNGVKPATIPVLLSSLQSEWDAMMLEQYSLRQQLSLAHQELSRALYDHEAACRVIAKLLKERDALKRRLHDSGDTENADDDDQEALPSQLIEEIDANANRLKSERQTRVPPKNLTSKEDVARFIEHDSVEPHTTGVSVMGVVCLNILETYDSSLVFTGGLDGRAICYDVTNHTIRSIMVGHSGPVRCIGVFDHILLTGSDDCTIRVWRASNGVYNNTRVIKAHEGCVIDLEVLPSKKHVLSAGSDGNLSFTDFERGFTLANGRSEEFSSGFSCFGLHPDGYLAVSGSEGMMQIWDVKLMKLRMTLGDRTHGSITGLSFNENGYNFAASTSEGTVKLYDFRKIGEPMSDITSGISTNKALSANQVAFSTDGSYLAVASDVVKVWDWKTSTEIVTLTAHTGVVTDVCWGSNANWLASTSLDKSLKIYRPQAPTIM